MVRSGPGIAVAVLATGSIAFFASPAQASHGLNCDDFSSRAQAQAYFDRHPGDPEGLDRDNDGQACETYPYANRDTSDSDDGTSDGSGTGANGGSGSTTPRGGVAAGAGGMAGGASFPALPAAGAGLGVLLAGAGVVAGRRRAAVE